MRRVALKWLPPIASATSEVVKRGWNVGIDGVEVLMLLMSLFDSQNPTIDDLILIDFRWEIFEMFEVWVAMKESLGGKGGFANNAKAS